MCSSLFFCQNRTDRPSVLMLEAHLIDNPSHCALPRGSVFCKSFDKGLRLIVTAIRERQALTGFPNLQESLRRLQDKKSGQLAHGRCTSC